MTSGGYTCDEAWQIQLAHKRARRAEIRKLKKRLAELEARDRDITTEADIAALETDLGST